MGHAYRLRSVARHHGHAMGKGHYSCYAYNDHDAAQSWVHFNDEVVELVTEEDVLKQEAYMMFYERTS